MIAIKDLSKSILNNCKDIYEAKDMLLAARDEYQLTTLQFVELTKEIYCNYAK